MKKSNSAILLLLLLLPLSPIKAGNLHQIEIEYDFYLVDRSVLLNSLARGNKAQIILQTRLYRKVNSRLPLPDKMICRFSFTRTIEKDTFSDQYRLTDSSGNIEYLENENDIFKKFLKIETEVSAQCDLSRGLSEYYIKNRAILILKVYTKPFYIFQIADIDNRITTEWETLPLKQE